MSRIDRGEEHDLKRIVKVSPTDIFSGPRYYAQCWCGDCTPNDESQAEARRSHEEHQREERGMVATPSEHYAKADKLLAGLYKIDQELREKFGKDLSLVPEELAELLHDTQKYTVEMAAVHAALAGVPPVVAQLAEQEQRKAAKPRETFARRPVKDAPQA